jgi:hypothetical protein
MQKTGNIFDKKYILLDKTTGIVYRREAFNINHGTMELPQELLVRDKRFTKDEIENLSKNAGFSIVQSKYVALGDWHHEVPEGNAKEIMLILKKQS